MATRPIIQVQRMGQWMACLAPARSRLAFLPQTHTNLLSFLFWHAHVHGFCPPFFPCRGMGVAFSSLPLACSRYGLHLPSLCCRVAFLEQFPSPSPSCSRLLPRRTNPSCYLTFLLPQASLCHACSPPSVSTPYANRSPCPWSAPDSPQQLTCQLLYPLAPPLPQDPASARHLCLVDAHHFQQPVPSLWQQQGHATSCCYPPHCCQVSFVTCHTTQEALPFFAYKRPQQRKLEGWTFRQLKKQERKVLEVWSAQARTKREKRLGK